MADYKDIINGTIGNLVNKVKGVANSETVKNVYEQGANRAKSYGRIAKLTLENNGDTEELKRVYTEIGKLYYEQAKDAPEGFFASLFAQAGELHAKLDAREAEIEALKAELTPEEPDIRVDIEEEKPDAFEEVVTATEDAAEAPSETPDKE